MPRKPFVHYDEALVIQTLDTIASERGHFNCSFELVDQVLHRMGESELAERLYQNIPNNRSWRDLADLFGILLWSTSDNGSAMMQTFEQWLGSTSEARLVQIALHLDAYPFKNREAMENVLGEVAERIPTVAGLCHEMIESRRRSPSAAAS